MQLATANWPRNPHSQDPAILPANAPWAGLGIPEAIRAAAASMACMRFDCLQPSQMPAYQA
jgi:hypothetical protein